MNLTIRPKNPIGNDKYEIKNLYNPDKSLPAFQGSFSDEAESSSTSTTANPQLTSAASRSQAKIDCFLSYSCQITHESINIDSLQSAVIDARA